MTLGPLGILAHPAIASTIVITNKLEKLDIIRLLKGEQGGLAGLVANGLSRPSHKDNSLAGYCSNTKSRGDIAGRLVALAGCKPAVMSVR